MQRSVKQEYRQHFGSSPFIWSLYVCQCFSAAAFMAYCFGQRTYQCPGILRVSRLFVVTSVELTRFSPWPKNRVVSPFKFTAHKVCPLIWLTGVHSILVGWYWVDMSPAKVSRRANEQICDQSTTPLSARRDNPPLHSKFCATQSLYFRWSIGAQRFDGDTISNSFAVSPVHNFQRTISTGSLRHLHFLYEGSRKAGQSL